MFWRDGLFNCNARTAQREPDVLKQHISSIFSVQGSIQTVAEAGGRLLLLTSCFAYSSILKMEATFSSETVGCLRTVGRYNPDDHFLHSHRRESLKNLRFLYRLNRIPYTGNLRRILYSFNLFDSCTVDHISVIYFTRNLWFFFPLALQPNSGLGRLHESSVSLQLLDLGQSVWLLGRVIISSQGLYLYTNTKKRTHNTNTKHPYPEWDSKLRSRRPRERRQFIPQAGATRAHKMRPL
jgi:hypothetical protein